MRPTRIENVLSLFDGLSAAQIALRRAGIEVGNYHASEIDKYCIKVTQARFPDTIQLGDITKIRGQDLPKNIDLIIGGSPCQGFSFMSNDRLDFEDARSKLFFEFVRLVDEINPRYFMLENVRMSKQSKEVINGYFGEPHQINSALLSGQQRNRYYWTNIPNIKQPDDMNIPLTDILEDDATEPMLSNIYGGFKEKKPRLHYGKSVTIRANSGGGAIPSVTKKVDDKHYLSQKMVDYIMADKYGNKGGINPEKARPVTASVYKMQRADYCTYISGDYSPPGKTNIRKLTVKETERLQTIPDGYTDVGISDTQRFKMIGNSYTVSVVSHILSSIHGFPQPTENPQQLKLI